VGGEKPLDGRTALVLQAIAGGLRGVRISKFFLRDGELLEGQRGARVRAELIGGVCKITLLKKRKAVRRLINVLDDEITRRRRQAFEFGDGAVREFGVAIG
jgi:hypothetical protein